MGQIYKVIAWYSEASYADYTPEKKSAELKETGLTFMYNRSGRRTDIFFDSGADTDKSNELLKFGKNILQESSETEFKRAYENCFEAIGYLEK